MGTAKAMVWRGGLVVVMAVAARAVVGPSLVLQGITQPRNRVEVCPNAGWLKGTCQHGTVRWRRLNCKRRFCEVCGQHRRERIAWRIARGIEVLAGEDGGGWFVGTFAEDVTKLDAVRVEGKFLRWLRKGERVRKVRRGEAADSVPWRVKPQPGLQYAATWEVTKRGRLHLNLVMAPWCYIPQKELAAAWRRFGGGGVSWIQRVGGGVGVEASKSREGLGGYLGKFEQLVETGRGVAFSEKWPRLPENGPYSRRGEISWGWMPGRVKKIGAAGVAENYAAIAMFEYECDLGWWWQVWPGEFAFKFEGCDCFEWSRGP